MESSNRPSETGAFAPLFARIIENDFSARTKPSVGKLIWEGEEIDKHFVSFTWTHTNEENIENDDREPSFEQVVTKFVCVDDKIKETRKKKQM
ncbi:hypothetical protein Ruko_09340 [Ruthenibacterium sp. TH_2024_36131]|uniref:hypothetical protein n=1 Tax=Owariibacterium komagatae TaxID=3136601 RepID=UPI0038B3E9B3